MSTLDIIATLRKALKLSDSAQLSVHPSGAVNHVYRLQNVALHYEGTEIKLQFHSDSEKAFRHRQTGQVVEGEQNQGRDPKQSCCVGDFAVKWLGDDRFSGIDRTYQFALQKKLCRLGLAPQPIWLSDDETIWVEQWQSDTTNPSLTPHFRDDYPPISAEDLDNDLPRLAYLELGDEVIDMREVQSQLENYMLIDAVEGGHHRLEQPEKINHLIEHIQKQYFK